MLYSGIQIGVRVVLTPEGLHARRSKDIISAI